MKTIVVTPAGRERYMRLLYLNILREKYDVDHWDIWVNTNIKSDIEYCRKLAFENKWIRIFEIPGINDISNWNICKFFKFATDKDSVYVRLDDDIVYLESGFFGKLKRHRLSNKKPFLVYANIINNSIISHIHQRNGLIDDPVLCNYDCLHSRAWLDPFFAEKVHRSFISDVRDGMIEKWHSSFNRWICSGFERVSINAVSWMGEDMHQLGGVVDPEEEECLSVSIPKRTNRPNEIFGGAIAAHFAFWSQRDHMDKTNLLKEYEALI